MSSATSERSIRAGKYLSAALLAGAALWAYFPTLMGLARLWSTDPNYSQGFMVPLLALGLLWHRCRGAMPAAEPAPLWGLGLLAVAAALRGAGAYFFVTPLDHLSLLVMLSGLC